MATEIPARTRMGAVHLSVSDLARSIDYYESAIGLRVHSRDGDRAALGTGGEDLLVLTEKPGAQPANEFCGLFHFALLLPERADLAHFLMHAANEQVPLTGLSDHYVSEALYLRDPDGHGIEIYWDRSRELWEGDVAQRLTTAAARRQRSGARRRARGVRRARLPARSWATCTCRSPTCRRRTRSTPTCSAST